MEKKDIKLNESEILSAYKEFKDLLGTYKSFNQFYGKVMRMKDNLEIIDSIDCYSENEIMLKVLYKQYYVFEVGMLIERLTDRWDYIDSMWVYCEDGSTFGEYYEINLHDLVLYNEVKLSENNG
jgi:hypothetical protein